jgi:hypothetical protein
MTNYIPHYTKKKQILARKEQKLRCLLEQSADLQKLITAAEGIRDARIRVLRAKRATIPPEGTAQVAFDRIDQEIDCLLSTAPQIILAEFGYSSND